MGYGNTTVKKGRCINIKTVTGYADWIHGHLIRFNCIVIVFFSGFNGRNLLTCPKIWTPNSFQMFLTLIPPSLEEFSLVHDLIVR